MPRLVGCLLLVFVLEVRILERVSGTLADAWYVGATLAYLVGCLLLLVPSTPFRWRRKGRVIR